MIRLQRVGRKHEPTFRLVLTDSKNGPKSGKYLEVLGSYDPRKKNTVDQFNIPRIKECMATGAKLSDTVHNFLVSEKVIEGKKINALPKKSPIKKEGAEEEKVEEVKTEEVKAEETKTETPAEPAPKVETPSEEVKEETSIETKKEEEKPVEETPVETPEEK